MFNRRQFIAGVTAAGLIAPTLAEASDGHPLVEDENAWGCDFTGDTNHSILYNVACDTAEKTIARLSATPRRVVQGVGKTLASYMPYSWVLKHPKEAVDHFTDAMMQVLGQHKALCLFQPPEHDSSEGVKEKTAFAGAHMRVPQRLAVLDLGRDYGSKRYVVVVSMNWNSDAQA